MIYFLSSIIVIIAIGIVWRFFWIINILDEYRLKISVQEFKKVFFIPFYWAFYLYKTAKENIEINGK